MLKLSDYLRDFGHEYDCLCITIDVSSSSIRRMVKEGKIIYPLVTEKVNNYIQNLNLYK